MERLLSCLRRFRRSEDGSMVVPFALWLPIFLGILFSGIEIGAIAIRHTVLEASLDEVVRDIRLGTGGDTHDAVKDAICAKATILPNCNETLRLEMVVQDLRAWTSSTEAPDCIDVAQPIKPVRSFTSGGANTLMVLRACYKYAPVTAHLGLGASLQKDSAGNTALISTSAFVQEP